MKHHFFLQTLLLLACGLFMGGAAQQAPLPRLPYAEAGLTERQAAVHLISRFTYGARPGQVDRVVELGLEQWLDRQLQAGLSEPSFLKKKLASFKALDLSPVEAAHLYPPLPQVVRQAARLSGMTPKEMNALKGPEREKKIRKYLDKSGQRPRNELIAELLAQKILRATYSNNQLADVLTDFWFNHFNVTLQDEKVWPYVLSYERDAIRPHVLGSFRAMLGATAKHPAMLLYLDNAQSTAPKGVLTTAKARRWQLSGNQHAVEAANRQPQPEAQSLKRSINENYARELMELHTLGVDGGYTQKDVEEVARALTGWTYVRSYEHEEKVRQLMNARNKLLGFVHDDAFFFDANAHDARPKRILNVTFLAGGGLEEGERVLDLLVMHPSTAYHLAEKIATRFVSDTPPQALVDQLAETFQRSEGNLQEVIRTLAYSPHFWSRESLKSKVKSPFELAISAFRSLNANIHPGRTLVAWMDKMGQPLYRYPAPTGFPDQADHWINAGLLLNRINFGLDLATGKIDGVYFDLLALNADQEPESVEAALTTYLGLLLPEGDTAATASLLLPLVKNPDLEARLEASVEREDSPSRLNAEALGGLALEVVFAEASSPRNPSSLARTIGVILGSPDFQRR